MAKNDAGAAQRSPGGKPAAKRARASPAALRAAAQRIRAINEARRANPGVGKRKCYSASEQQRLWDLVILELRAGKTLNQSLADVPGSPSGEEFLRWRKEITDGESLYAEARLTGYERMADHIVELSDVCRVGKTITEKADGGVEVVFDDMIARSRLQVDTRKWLMSKCLPKMYGDRTVLATESGDALAAALLAIAERLPV